MARRGSKRTDLTSQSMVTFLLPEQLDEALQFYDPKNKAPAFSLQTEVRSDLTDLLGVNISNVAWDNINDVTAKYVEHAQGYREALNSADVKAACTDIIVVLDRLIATINKHDRSPGMNAFLSHHAVAFDIRKMAALWKSIFQREIKKCSGEAQVAVTTGWDKW